MNEEKIKILKMIEDGIITAEEGSNLLNAIDDSNKIDDSKKSASAPKGDKINAKWLRVKVLSTENGIKTKVNVNVPIALVETGLKIGKHFNKDMEASMNDLNFNEIMDMIKNGAEGKIVEVESENGDIVEVYVD